MILIETIKINDKEYKKAYSDSGYLIRKIGTDEMYEEAIDLLETVVTYEETDIIIEEEMSELEQKAQAYDILIGEVE